MQSDYPRVVPVSSGDRQSLDKQIPAFLELAHDLSTPQDDGLTGTNVSRLSSAMSSTQVCH